ncbi:helix-turn-helix domain-containing protein [Staphylococcus shinii]|uniref:helix-turn-helix domain-containing protein n=1 Tax=Staphylococcus shinii TaxID=2912228 RepID=UPI003EE92030
MVSVNIDKYIKAVGEIIREVRKSQNISSKEASEKLGISAPYYSRLENSKINKVSLSIISKLANNVNITLSDLLYEADNRVNSNHIKNIICYYDYEIQEEKLLLYILNEIKEERLSKGISQYKIAEDMHIVRQYYSDIESGKNKSISLYRLLEVTEVIETPLYILVERAEHKIENKSEI